MKASTIDNRWLEFQTAIEGAISAGEYRVDRIAQRLGLTPRYVDLIFASRSTTPWPPRAIDVKSDGMDPPAFLSVEVAGRSLPPRMALEEDER